MMAEKSIIGMAAIPHSSSRSRAHY